MRQLLGADMGRREPIDLNEIAREALRLVGRHAAARGVDLSATLGERLPPAIGDPAQILQVALGLILQAVNHAATSRSRAVAVRTALREEGMELAVSDSGEVISEVDRAHMFEPLAATRSGGLGITLVRSIVEAHAGRLAVERPESGALFRVVLPVGTAGACQRSGGG
jgi:signal transduction histidine kinase